MALDAQTRLFVPFLAASGVGMLVHQWAPKPFGVPFLGAAVTGVGTFALYQKASPDTLDRVERVLVPGAVGTLAFCFLEEFTDHKRASNVLGALAVAAIVRARMNKTTLALGAG